MHLNIKIHTILALIISLVSIINVAAQDFSRLDIDFIKDGQKLTNPLAGGLRAGQFSQIDLNDDGKKDLFVFDRGSKQILTFINEGGVGEIEYRFDPSYEHLFPEVESWVLLRDFNEDGIEDLFTSFAGGIHVYRGKKDNGVLSYEIINFANAPGGFNQLPFPSGAFYLQVESSGSDIPVIEDMDFDGDLDILSFSGGGSYVAYYENQVKERFLNTDTLEFILKDLCWGKFFESGISEDLTLTTDCSICATFDGKALLHAGSTLCAFDGDGDNDMDLLIGDLSNNNMVYVTNGGNKEFACAVDQDLTFPSYDTPIDLFVFNAAFIMDINNDGKRDLIATSNNADGRNKDHVWLYLNEGEDNAPIFRLKQKDFLMSQMLTFGANSAPTFVDYNQDGLQDLVIGNAGTVVTGNDKTGSIELWLNTGTKSQAEFTLEDDDFLEFKGLSNNGTNFSPAFGDIDNDGDLDLFVGDVNGQLYFYRNKAGQNTVFDFESRKYPFADIFVGQSSVPSIADIDNDGINDLIIGEGRDNLINGVQGSLNYYKNFGSIGMENFSDQATSKTLYRFLSGEADQGFYSSTPTFIPNPEGGNYLFVGSDLGEIYVLTDLSTDVNTPATILTSNLGELNIGRRTSVAVADIDNDPFLEIIVGSARGGLEAYNTNLLAKMPVGTNEDFYTEIEIFPNPSSAIFTLHTEIVINEVYISSIDGKLSEQIPVVNNQINLSHFPDGLYIVKIQDDKKIKTIKIIKI